MTWQSVGTHTFVPTDKAVQVGSFDLAAGQDTIWVRITQLNNPGDWPWSYGILSWRNADGTPLGSLKAYSNRLGEVFRLGNGLPPSDGAGSIWFEPRGFNLGWLKAGFPWELQFEAQAGASGGQVTSYWNRDPVNGVLSPVTAGDDVALGPGSLSATNATLSSAVFCQEVVARNPITDNARNLEVLNAGGGSTMYVLGNGAIFSTNLSINPIGSERRLKENVTPIDAAKAWETIKTVPYYSYNFIGLDPGSPSYGPMVDEVPADLVLLTDRSDDQGNIRTFDNGLLQARLYTALQLAIQRIEELERLVNKGLPQTAP